MLALQKLLTQPSQPHKHPMVRVWLSLSLAIAFYYGVLSLQYAFAGDYIVQDDARHYLIATQRFIDPNLFPNDLIADYYQAVTPSGYAVLFRAIAALGVEPTVAIKVLPLGLGLVTTVYCFWVSLSLFAVPAAAFTSTLILNQALWLRHDLVSAAPRAFVYPLFFAFLYYLLKQQLVPLLIAIALQGLFYPSAALVEVAVLSIRLLRYRNGRISPSQNRRDYLFWLAGAVIALVALLAYTPELSKFGPVVNLAQAKAMPEFGPNGRIGFFVENPFAFWLTGDSGVHFPVYPPIIWISVLFPLLQSRRLPLAKHLSEKISLLGQILVASFGLFLLAHLLLLRLYYPGRYTEHSLIIVMALATGITLILLLEIGLRWLHQQPTLKLPQRLLVGLISFFLVTSLVVPEIPAVVSSAYDLIIGKAPQVYEFLQQTPKATLTASLSEEASNLPIFAHRPILIGREYALPYHVKYYTQIRQRAIDLIEAQYSSEPELVKQFIQKYKVDYFLIDPNAFTPEYLATNAWLQQYQPATDEAIKQLQQGEQPVLSKLSPQCAVLETQGLTLVKAECIAQNLPLQSTLSAKRTSGLRGVAATKAAR